MPTTWTPAYSYDPTTTDPTLLAISTLRLRLGDTDFSQVTTPPLSVMFADQELQIILTQNINDLVFSTCDALLMIAANKSRLSTFVQLQGGGSVDMRAVANELRTTSKEMRDLYINVPAFQTIEMDWTQFSSREIIWNSIQRTEGST